MTYKKRDIVAAVTEALSEMPVVVVAGMRQTGKSTFLQNQPELKGRRYVTFDDFTQIEAAGTVFIVRLLKLCVIERHI